MGPLLVCSVDCTVPTEGELAMFGANVKADLIYIIAHDENDSAISANVETLYVRMGWRLKKALVSFLRIIGKLGSYSAMGFALL